MRAALIMAFVANLITLGVSRALLPAQVASSFNEAGQANELVPRDSYLLLSTGLSTFVCLVFLLLATVMPYLPPQLINLPHKEFWLAPQRAADTYRKLTALTAALGIVILMFTGGMQMLVVVANRAQPPQLPMLWFLVAIGLLLISTAGVIGYWVFDFMWPGDVDAQTNHATPE